MNTLIIAVCAAATGCGLSLIVLTALRPRTMPEHKDAFVRELDHATHRSLLSGHPAARGYRRRAPLRRILLSAGTGITLLAITSWPVLLPVGAAAAWFLPNLLRADGGSESKIEKVEAIATFAEMMRDTLNAAAGLGQAISAAARCASDSIAAEAQELAAAIEDRTVPMDRALRTFGDKLADPAGDLVVIALTYAARNSARDLAAMLSDLADAARSEAAMRVRIGIARTRTRTAVRLITGVTLGLGAVLYVFDDPFLAPYAGTLGQLALLTISTLFATGFAWLTRLSRPTEQPRLLRSASSTDQGPDESATAAGGLLPAPRRGNAPSFSAGGR